MSGLIYILFVAIALVALVSVRDPLFRQVVWFLFGVVLCCVAGFRSADSVPDYTVYDSMFRDIVDSGTLGWLVEPTFSLISLASWRLGAGSLGMFVVYAVLGVGLKIRAIRGLLEPELWFAALAIYFSTFFLLHEMVQIRAGVAASFILLSLKPAVGRRFLPFVLCVFAAAMFHYSALAAGVIWFLPRVRRSGWRRWALWCVVPLGLVIYALGLNPLGFVLPEGVIGARLGSTMAAQAGGAFDSVSVLSPGRVLRIVVFYFLLWFHRPLADHNPAATLMLWVYAAGLFIGLAFGTVPVVGDRLGDLFLIVEIVLVPLLCYVVRPRVVARGIVVLIGLCHFLLSMAVGDRLVV